MSNSNNLIATGTIVKVIPGGDFKVKIENDHILHCYVSGKLRKNYIKLVLGDIVTIEVSPYDLTKGRIIYRGVRPY